LLWVLERIASLSVPLAAISLIAIASGFGFLNLH
jgi:hypothetical protein